MRIDGITLVSNSDVVGTKIETGTQTERLALTPHEGMMFYQTDNTPNVYMYIGSAWSVYGGGGSNPVTLDNGNSEFLTSQIYTFTITNHNTFSTYTGVSSLGGSVIISGDQITYTTSVGGGTDILTITQDGVGTAFSLLVTTPPHLDNLFLAIDRGGVNTQYIYATCVDLSRNTYSLLEDKSTNPDEMHVVKISGDGTIVWQRKYTSTNDFSLETSGISTDGNFVYIAVAEQVAGHSVLIKLDATNGSILWQFKYSNISRMNAVIIDGNDLYVQGVTTTKLSISKISSTDGSIIWSKTFEGSTAGSGSAQGMVLFNNELYALMGVTAGGESAMSVYKVNVDGTLISINLLSKTGKTYEAWGIAVDSSGIYVCGREERPNFTYNVVITKISLTGTSHIWTKGFRHASTGTNSTTRYETIVLTTNGVYASGAATGQIGSGILTPLLTKFDKTTGTVAYHSMLVGSQQGRYHAMTAGDTELAISGFANTGSQQDAILVQNDDDGVSMTGILPNHTSLSFITPTLTDDSGDLIPTVAIQGTALDTTVSAVPTSLSIVAGASTLTSTISNY